MSFLSMIGPPPSSLLISILDQHLGGMKVARTIQNVHASALTGQTEFCPREVSLARVLDRHPEPEYISAATQVAFDLGNALHDLFRNKWAKDICVGTWHCLSCDKEYPFSKHPGKCIECVGTELEYREEFFQSSDGYQGSIDSLVDFGAEKLTIVELKSIDKDKFATLKAPVAEHRVRTILYMHLVKTSDSPNALKINTEKAKVLYISKGFGVKSESGAILPFKEFEVLYSASTIEPYLKLSRQVRDALVTGIIPAGICPTIYATRAKKCCCKTECFSGKYPWPEPERGKI